MVWQLFKNQSGPKWKNRIVETVKPFTMTSDTNLRAFIKAVEEIEKNKTPGAIVECGVWKGGSMMAAAQTLFHLDNNERELYLFDTFDSFPEPGKEDISHEGKTGREIIETLKENDQPWKAPSVEAVKENLYATGYPKEKINFVKGDVMQTLPASAPEEIAILRLDTDWYESTFHELRCLYPRLSGKGILIIDDYGYWKGCKKAVDEYFGSNNIEPGLVKIDFSSRMHYKKA
jgi:hypothetical protein